MVNTDLNISTLTLADMGLFSPEELLVNKTFRLGEMSMQAHYVRILAFYLNVTSRLLPRVESGGGGAISSNGSWVGVAALVRNQQAILGVQGTVTYLRSTVVEFTTPFYFDRFTFAIRTPGHVFRATAILKTMDAKAWILVIVSVVIRAGVLIITDNKTTTSCWLSSIKPLLDQPMIENLRNRNWRASLRINITFCIFSSLVLSTAIKSKMVAFMALPIQEKYPHSFQELCVEKYSSVVAQPWYPYLKQTLQAAAENTDQESGECLLYLKSNLHPLSSWKDCFSSITNFSNEKSDIACIIPFNKGSSEHQSYVDEAANKLTLLLPEGDFFFFSASMVAKQSSLKGVVNHVIFSLFEAGFFFKWQEDREVFLLEKGLQNARKHRITPKLQTSSILDVHKIQSAFWVLVWGSSCALIILFVEINIFSRVK